MTNFLLDKQPLGNLDNIQYKNTHSTDDIFEGTPQSAVSEEGWKKLLMPQVMGGMGGMGGNKEALPLDLSTLLRVLDEHNKDAEAPNQGTWQLVLIQAILLIFLVLISVAWACCCKRKCFSAAPPSVHEALRKLSSNASVKSKDFPPSYSQADLHTLAMSVHDYLYPPPQYPDTLRSCDDLAYLDLEGGHRQLAKLSFSGSCSPVILGHPALSRQASTLSYVDSRKSSISTDSVSSRKNSIMKDSSSRRSSTSPDSRRSSRVSFSEAVECSNGSFRRLAGSLDTSRKSSNSSTASGGDLLRRSSSSLLLSRKLGLSQESLDKELRKKLEAIEIAEAQLAENQNNSDDSSSDGSRSDSGLEFSRDSSSCMDSSLETVMEIPEVQLAEIHRPSDNSLDTVIEVEKY